AGGPSKEQGEASAGPVLPPVPVLETQPTLSGEARQGVTLKETHGKWSNNPTSYELKWERCEGSGAPPCTVIASAANKQEYTLEAADVGHKIKVLETAVNAGGPSKEQGEASAGPVQPPAQTEENWGKATIAGSKDYFGNERKRVNCYATPGVGAVTKLNVYLE